jgi:hypothetical protein
MNWCSAAGWGPDWAHPGETTYLILLTLRPNTERPITVTEDQPSVHGGRYRNQATCNERSKAKPRWKEDCRTRGGFRKALYFFGQGRK